MRYHVTHSTTYDYDEPVTLCQNLAHLTPRELAGQRCLDTRLAISPRPAVISERVDYFGNPATFFSLQEPHRRLVIQAEHTIELQPSANPDPGQSPPWEEARELLASHRQPELVRAYQFVLGSRYAGTNPELRDYTASSFTPGRPILLAVLDLMHRIHTDFVYDPQATTVSTPLGEVFAQRRGVCQDFAHLQIACLRGLGLASRYVSGYLCTTAAPGQQCLVGADATHAWLGVWMPTIGWVAVDPTNDQMPTDKHLVLAWGRDYDDVSPVKGVILGGGRHSVHVAVAVVPVE